MTEEKQTLIEGKDIDPGAMSKGLRIAPSKRVIYQMPKNILLKHNALIFHKASSLSSTQRKLVMNRVAYGINAGTITADEVAKDINHLNRMIQGELTKAVKKDVDSPAE